MPELNKIISSAITIITFIFAAASIPLLSKHNSKKKRVILFIGIVLLIGLVTNIAYPYLTSRTDQLVTNARERHTKAQTVIGATNAGQLVNAVAGVNGFVSRTYATVETTTGVFRTEGFDTLTKGVNMYVQSRANGTEYLCDASSGGNCYQIVR